MIRRFYLLMAIVLLFGLLPAPAAAQSGETVLLDQTPAYGAMWDDITSYRLAENFVLAEPQTIVQVELFGTYANTGGGPAAPYPDNFSLIIHADAAGLPGAAIYTEHSVASTREATGAQIPGGWGDQYRYTLALGAGQTLPAGAYWIEIYNNSLFSDVAFVWQIGNADTLGAGRPGFAYLSPYTSTWEIMSESNLALRLFGPALVHYFTWDPVTPLEGGMATFTGDPALTEWLWWKGSAPGMGCDQALGGGQVMAISFGESGDYQVCFQGWDPNLGGYVYDDQWVTVANVAPTFYPEPASWNASPEPSTMGEPFHVAVSFMDWDHSFTCTVDYGDGTGPQAGTLPYLPEEKVCVGPDHIYTAPGSYTVSAAVTDSDGDTGTGTYVHVVEEAALPSLQVGSIQLTYKVGKAGKSGSTYIFTGQVTIVDELAQPVNKAAVEAQWTLADGSALAQTATTGKTGVATFRGPKGGEGIYTLCVTNVTKAGMAFTPGANDCASVTVPGSTPVSSESSSAIEVPEVYLPLMQH